MDMLSIVPTYVLMLKIDYEKADMVVDSKGGETLDRNHHGYGARHHNHDSSWLGKWKVSPKRAHHISLVKL